MHGKPILFTILQVLYSEQVRGFPGRRVLTLRCELFGLAGHYALFLRPTTNTPTIPHTAAYVKVKPSILLNIYTCVGVYVCMDERAR